MQHEDVLRILRALAKENVEYVLVGGVAVGLHGLSRLTQAIDLFVNTESSNVDRLKRVLHAIFDDPAIDEISAAELRERYPTIRYGPPTGDYFVDIIARLGDAFTWKELEWQIIIVDDIPVRIATPQTLYRMKKDTLRLRDKADAADLREHFGLED